MPYPTPASAALANSLKALMRRVPQPVSIATVSISSPYPHFHGATLSSLTSISLAPLPLLAFSLRLPSRLAAAISQPPPSTDPRPAASPPTIILHYLSSSQTPLAEAFAKALPAPPTSSSSSRNSTPPAATPFTLFPHSPSREGIPILQGCVGAVSCRILGSIPLSSKGLLGVGFDIGSLACQSPSQQGSEQQRSEKEGGSAEATSELYIAEVVRMEDCVQGRGAEGDYGLPLVYHDQRYCGIGTGMGRMGRKVIGEGEGGGVV